jgi:plastocyanin
MGEKLMQKLFFVRRPMNFLVLLCLCAFILALGACKTGADSKASAPNTSSNAVSSSSSTGRAPAANDRSTSANSAHSSTSKSDSAASSTGAMTVTIKASKDASGKAIYTLDHSTITVKKGEAITFVNQSDEAQSFTREGASKTETAITVPSKQSSAHTFTQPGTMVLKNKAGNSLTITVKP